MMPMSVCYEDAWGHFDELLRDEDSALHKELVAEFIELYPEHEDDRDAFEDWALDQKFGDWLLETEDDLAWERAERRLD